MEGLIPMVYRSLKKTRTRRKYECLSSGAAVNTAYNIADFYLKDDTTDYFSRRDQYLSPGPDKASAHHRRCNSAAPAHRAGGLAMEGDHGDKSKQLVRFRSHSMFSCITGA